MEDKRQLEVFTGTGEDSINKQISKEQLDKVKEIEQDDARLMLVELEKNNENLRRMAWLEAYDRLDVKYREQISESDIDRLVKGEKLSGEAIDKLQEERQTLLEEKEQDLFKNFSKGLGKDMSECTKTWQAVKRAVLVGVVFNIPGLIFLIIKDSLDETLEKKRLKDAIEDFVKDENPDKLNSALNIAQHKFGKVWNVSELMNLVKSSDVISELKENSGFLKEVIAYKNSIVENLDKEFEEILDTEEIDESNMKEEEDEEDPEPVEGMKYM